ncbi:hypothetical protein BKA82DRAFT_145086 [Pisolithus tinctorius]|uniref:Uncharacterized protein n=1 Tax=Pisolithus tinctorius Marx 270 TaxID=870435 RepID=A0A0C3K1Y4_PISTI|nr:hypothetical protein BKA82DRAFT_145086 [Pisolithus tinctorius]KIO03562.1 hypothetical protein M404DRAFT_145086 [Pisolithus tinctorius Marx 270]
MVPQSSPSNFTCPTPETHLKICFWDQSDWNTFLDTRGTLGFLEEDNSDPPSNSTVKAIQKTLRGGWAELANHKLAPKSWGRLCASGRQLTHNLMESTFPLFRFAKNGWKLDYLASNSYPAWWKTHLESEGNWKMKKSQDCEDDNEDMEMDKKDKKWKLLEANVNSETLDKRMKGECIPCNLNELR